jgi:hypothetical protein
MHTTQPASAAALAAMGEDDEAVQAFTAVEEGIQMRLHWNFYGLKPCAS